MKENMTLDFNFTLTVGDWSRDGHNQFDVIPFKCNSSLATVSAAHIKASKDFDLKLEDQCKDYEDYHLSIEFYARLLEAFKDNPDIIALIDEPADEETGPWIDTITFAELYMQIAKLAILDLEWELIKTSESNENIGGYGLFS